MPAQVPGAVTTVAITVPVVLSFVIPAFNEEVELPGTIEAIHRAAKDRYAFAEPERDTPASAEPAADRQYEIIVVDDASTDGTPEVARNAGAKVVSIHRRQIAAARNAGARASHGDILFFVDGDTRINAQHVSGAINALASGCAAGSARVLVGGAIPVWARIFIKTFCAFYFSLKLGAGAFLFTTRKNFDAVGGFDEKLFVGEEVYFSLAVRRLGRFRILLEPVVTSGRKLRMYSARDILGNSLGVILRWPRALRSRDRLRIWYDGRREVTPTMTNDE
ncbi:MAG TPA: glycosyltransferase [Chthoniobacterales bacterium]|nr:glycosyltransferase [Chthoniobacterales bacterium]